MKKKIIALLLISMLGISNSYANEVSYTFDEARQIGISNSKEIKLQDEIIDSLKNKNYIQKKDYLQNNPDYEYNGMAKTEVYNNTYKTYDYEKILKNNIQTKKEMIIANEKKTLTLFTNIINYQNEIKNKQMQIDNQIQSLNHAQVKLKTGMITQVDYDSEKNALDALQTELKNLNFKLDLEEKRFKQHLNIDLKDKVNLKLTQPELNQLLPQDALEITEKNKKTFEDIKKELDDLNKDMKWIEQVNYGENYKKYKDEQQKLIDEKEKDIKELKKNTLYNYDKIYYNILIKANELSLEKLNKMQLDIKKKQMTALYNQGVDKRLSVDEIDTQIQSNLLSQIKKQLEIRWMLLDYNTSTI